MNNNEKVEEKTKIEELQKTIEEFGKSGETFQELIRHSHLIARIGFEGELTRMLMAKLTMLIVGSIGFITIVNTLLQKYLG